MKKECIHEFAPVTFSTFVKGESPKKKMLKCKKCGDIIIITGKNKSK